MSQFGNHDDRPTKTVELSRSEVTHVVMQIDINGQGRLFGGRLMEGIDEVGGMTAMRHSTHEVITASVDNLTFKAETRLNDMVVMIGKKILVFLVTALELYCMRMQRSFFVVTRRMAKG